MRIEKSGLRGCNVDATKITGRSEEDCGCHDGGAVYDGAGPAKGTLFLNSAVSLEMVACGVENGTRQHKSFEPAQVGALRKDAGNAVVDRRYGERSAGDVLSGLACCAHWPPTRDAGYCR